MTKPVQKEWEPKHKEGDLVQAQYGGGRECFYAMILSLSKVEGFYSLIYTDGEREERKESTIRSDISHLDVCTLSPDFESCTSRFISFKSLYIEIFKNLY